MRPVALSILSGLVLFAAAGFTPQSDGPYHVLKTVKVGGDGGFDYVYADSSGRKLYIARSGQAGHVAAFDLDKGLTPAGDIPQTRAHGAAADAKTHHAFASSKPVAMWDTNTMQLIKTIDVDGNPDGLLNDDYNHRTYIFSHSAPNATVIDDKDGAVLGTIDLGGAPEQAAADGHGKLFVDLEDKDSVAVVDANTMKVINTFSLNGKGGGNAGLALDARNHVLFVACRNPQVMVMLDSNTGKYLADLPINGGCDGAVFNPKTNECFSSHGDGTLIVIKEKSPTSFEVEQTIKTMVGGKTCTLDAKTGQILIIAAEYGPAPAAADNGNGNGRRRRGPMLPGSFSVVVVGK